VLQQRCEDEAVKEPNYATELIDNIDKEEGAIASIDSLPAKET